MKLFLGFLLIQPERDNTLGRNTAFLLFYIHLGRSAHGADRGRIVLAEQDLAPQFWQNTQEAPSNATFWASRLW